VSAVVDRISKVKDHKGVSILLLGHADDVGNGRLQHVLVSQGRAEAVKELLVGAAW
jgi:outer membrane protein OmpA-like peptidoglycan-associated protein